MDTKNVNEFSVTGRISYKRYDARERKLQFVLAVLLPRVNRQGKDGEDFYRDFPGFVLTGDEAEKWNAQMERGDRMTIRGHLESSRQQEWAGRNYYKLVYVIQPIIEEMSKSQGLVMKNYVRLKGKVSRVLAGAGNSHYYIVTIRTELPDGTYTSIPCFYFDPRMELDPKSDDNIDAEGVFTTRRVPLEFDKDRTSVRLSVSIQAVSIDRVSDPKSRAEKDTKSSPQVQDERVSIGEGIEVNPLDDSPIPEEGLAVDPDELVSETKDAPADNEGQADTQKTAEKNTDADKDANNEPEENETSKEESDGDEPLPEVDDDELAGLYES